MYFYIGIVFGLQGIYVTALFVTSWLMSGTWLAGMLTVAWFLINRYERGSIDVYNFFVAVVVRKFQKYSHS